MKNKLALGALGLWVVTILTFGYFFVHGVTEVSTDKRAAVLLTFSEKDLVLGEMRAILGAVNGVFEGLGNDDLAATARAAKSAGLGMAADANPALLAKLPLEFKRLGMSLHGDFDKLAVEIQKGAGKDQVLRRMGAITAKCVACHQAYRLSQTP